MNCAVIGTQWGDEGKGKIVDLISNKNSVKTIVRFQGGNNAGHTVVVKNKKYALHLLPSGILHKDKVCVIASEVIIDPLVLLEELKNIKNQKHAQIIISDKCQIIMPWHQVIDTIKGGKLGTTARGIGPTYTDYIAREGIRISDTETKQSFQNKINESLEWNLQLIALLLDFHKIECKMIQHLNLDKILNKEYILKTYWQALEKIKNNPNVSIGNTSVFLDKVQSQNSPILFEGAQATLLDICHGTYPFVTSSHPIFGGIFTGTGFRPRNNQVIGVVKAYTTRVGTGPFPTELEDKTGEFLRKKGHEFGTTTGRPRRCGWLDLPIINYAKIINGLDQIALTKIDVLSGIKKLKVAIAYEINGKKTNVFEPNSDKLENAKVIYDELPGWQEDITTCRKFEELPKNTQNYIKYIERKTKLPIKLIGVGPQRDEVIKR